MLRVPVEYCLVLVCGFYFGRDLSRKGESWDEMKGTWRGTFMAELGGVAGGAYDCEIRCREEVTCCCFGCHL